MHGDGARHKGKISDGDKAWGGDPWGGVNRAGDRRPGGGENTKKDRRGFLWMRAVGKAVGRAGSREGKWQGVGFGFNNCTNYRAFHWEIREADERREGGGAS